MNPVSPIDPPGWMFDGLCASHPNPDLWYPEKGWDSIRVDGGSARSQVREAKALCADCPVRLLCLENALQQGERYGIWGGKTERERRQIRRERRTTQLLQEDAA